MEWALHVMGFTRGVKVKGLEDDCASGHHVTGSPTGTSSSTPSEMSWSRPALISSCQWSGTGIGV